MLLPPDLTQLLAAFAAEGVRYLIIGGHAVSVHGRPRSTKDVDLWLASDADNRARACRALARFGVPAPIIDGFARSAPDEITWFGRAPCRVDLLQAIPGVAFDDAWQRRVVLDHEGHSVTVIGFDDLVANKRAVDRAVDRRDVAALLRLRDRAERSARAEPSPPKRKARRP